jgi:hypothetical protein
VPNQFRIKWHDAGREPQVAPNPAYPNGMDVDASDKSRKHCTVELPYPAKRCGYYVIACLVCRMNFACTTAGRPDDPRSMTVNCKSVEN